jgi:guanyl-specific ribonuclease Sa
MPIRDRILWGRSAPFSDPRLANLPALLRDFRRGNFHGWRSATFENREGHLPAKPSGHYREVHLGPTDGGGLRLVLGADGEVYLTGNHYQDFRPIVGIPRG